MPFVTAYGPSGLAGMAVLGVLAGWLIPRWTYRQMIAAKDHQIDRLEKTNEKQAEQLDELLELARTTVAAFDALPKPRERL